MPEGGDPGQHVLHVETRAILVASRLRITMEQRGWLTLPPRTPAPPDGFTLIVRPLSPAACAVHPDHTEAIPDELGRRLSQELRCRVTAVARVGTVCAYEVSEGGNVVEKLAVDGDRVLENVGSTLADEVAGGAALPDLLLARGLDGLTVTTEEAATTRRAVALGFVPRPGRGDGAVIEIDPTLSCPKCGAAMRKMEGKFGAFYGCVSFPECRGRLTDKQATAQREG